MPIDFPANPTNGMVYSNYIYDSSITAWRNVNTDTGIGTLNAMGLKNVVPTSISVGSGSATVNSNGLVTFTGASSISLNGVFSSTYKSYRLVFTGDRVGGTAGALFMRLRNGAPEADVTTNYAGAYTGFYYGGTTANSPGMGTAAQDLIPLYYDKMGVTVDITQPYEAAGTKFTGTGIGSLAANGVYTLIGGEHNSSTVFTGLSVIMSTSTGTGKLQILGYNG